MRRACPARWNADIYMQHLRYIVRLQPRLPPPRVWALQQACASSDNMQNKARDVAWVSQVQSSCIPRSTQGTADRGLHLERGLGVAGAREQELHHGTGARAVSATGVPQRSSVNPPNLHEVGASLIFFPRYRPRWLRVCACIVCRPMANENVAHEKMRASQNQ